MNVISGERYKMNPKESQALLKGEYGQLPAPVNEEVRRKVIGDAKVITCRPADLLKPELEHYRKEVAPYYQQRRTCSATPCSPRWPPSSSSTAKPRP